MSPRRASGFALILTLALLALLVLAVYALSALVRINGHVTTASTYQVQARQNAWLGLTQALDALQRAAGPDDRITAMAGVTGVAANAANSTRHWCSIWRTDGSFVAWMTSGASSTATATMQNGITTIELVSNGSVGAATSNSEHVIAGKLAIPVSETPGAPGIAATVGSYAYVVLDQGVKISAYSPPATLAIPSVKPLLTSTSTTSAQGRLRAALDTYVSRLPNVLSYEQLAVLPAPSTALTASVLQDNFHHVALTNRAVTNLAYLTGTINLNTTSTIVWRSVLETYNSIPGVTPIPASSFTTRGNAIANNFAASASGKLVNGPFASGAAFGSSALLSTNLPSSVTPAQFMAALGPVLTVRSDTFRIRAYGEATNLVDPTRAESVAYCEAIVQRTPDNAPNSLGRRFSVIAFRWLGPSDI